MVSRNHLETFLRRQDAAFRVPVIGRYRRRDLFNGPGKPAVGMDRKMTGSGPRRAACIRRLGRQKSAAVAYPVNHDPVQAERRSINKFSVRRWNDRMYEWRFLQGCVKTAAFKLQDLFGLPEAAIG